MTPHIRGYHLPGIEDHVTSELLRCGTVEVEVPRLRPAQLHTAIDGARRRALEELRGRSVDDLLAVADRVVANWLCPDYPFRQQAEQVLPAASGFSRETVRHGLSLMLERLRASEIRTLLDTELGNHHMLDRPIDGRYAAGPPLITHILSGNIPGLAAAPILLSLVLKSAVLVKAAAGDPIFPALLAASIDEVDHGLAQCVLVTYWRGGDRNLEAVALTAADLVVASGSDAAIAALAAHAPRRFIGHGHRVSFAAVGRECLCDLEATQTVARRLAYDVSLWDQQGCLSPQLCYVEDGGVVTPGEFAEQLGRALSQYAAELPPRQLSFDEQAEVQRFRQQAEWHEGTSETTGLLFSSGSTDWSISIEGDAEFVPTCLHRCLRIKVVSDLAQLTSALAPHRQYLEAAGLAVGAARAEACAALLAGCGVHRICPIGDMQRPPLSWRQGGRPRVADWVEWTVVEGREA